MPELDDQTFQTFSHFAGVHFTDAWMRKEIHQHINRITYGTRPQEMRRVTLVTSDLINALSASAEGIDVLYFSRAESDILLPRSYKIDQISQFIIISSILFEELTVKINSQEFVIKEIWEGKTPTEWITDSIMLTSKV